MRMRRRILHDGKVSICYNLDFATILAKAFWIWDIEHE